ncbi:MAG: hypothetical protein BalsKO_16250 [Balneolaceae bacterium]
MYRYAIIFLFIVSLIACSDSVVNLPEENELSQADSLLVSHFIKINTKGIIRYNDIFDRYLNLPSLIRKWPSDIDIYVFNWSNNDSALPAISKLISDMDSIRTDGYKISLTSDSSLANSFIFLGINSEFKNFFQLDSRVPTHESGSTLHWVDNENYIYKSASIFNPNNPRSEVLTKKALNRMITRIIGVTGTNESVPTSFFSSRDLREVPANYSELDLKVIELLYHPEMETGLDSAQTVEKLTEILGKN